MFVGRPSKRTERKAQLVQAALETIQRNGTDGLRIRDVAKAAGVSTATVHYYFDDLDGLWSEIHALAVERFCTDRLEAIAQHDDARAKLKIMIRDGLPETPDEPITVALYQMGNVKRTDPVRAALGATLYDRQVMMYLSILELGVGQGHFTIRDPKLDFARNLVGLEDAYCMHIIEANPSLPRERCLELMFSFARSATGCAELGAD